MRALLRGAPLRRLQRPAISLPTKFDTATDHLLIRVGVNAAPIWCNPDTGFSGLIAIDRAKAQKAGLRESGGRPRPDRNQPRKGDGSAMANVTIGSVTLPNQPLIVRELPREALDMGCIAGAGLLKTCAPPDSMQHEEGCPAAG